MIFSLSKKIFDKGGLPYVWSNLGKGLEMVWFWLSKGSNRFIKFELRLNYKLQIGGKNENSSYIC